MSENLKRKLTSRKFWAAVVSFVTMLIMAFGVADETATQVGSIIMAGATGIAYIIGEGMTDAAAGADGKDIPKELRMCREGVWTKAVVDAFVDEACLSDEDDLMIWSRDKGWPRTKQSMQYNLSSR